MAKTKNNREVLKALCKKNTGHGAKASNPFEIRTTKSKFSLFNRDRLQVRSLDVPGAQRAHAINKRKQTLGRDFLLKNKTNRFVDQRKEGQSMSSRRKQMYLLNDNVQLTHKGQTLEEIEHNNEPVDNDDFSDEDNGQLDDEFIKVVNFGGGDNVDRCKDRKSAIEEMIAESKRKKIEKQRKNDEVFQMTQKLDQNWQGLMSVVGNFTKTSNEQPKLEDYDRVMREMIFERRGKPADKLKSENELAIIEKQKSEEIERAKWLRMQETENEVKRKHRSADELDDDYLLWTIPNKGEDATMDINDCPVDSYSDFQQLSHVTAPLNVSDSEEASKDDSDSSNECDDLLDLKDFEQFDEVSVKDHQPPNLTVYECKSVNSIRNSMTKHETYTFQKETNDLPLTFEIPVRYEDLWELLSPYSADIQVVILERMLKSNKTVRDYKAKIITLFAFIIQYINDLFQKPQSESISRCFEIVEYLTPHLHDLMQLNPVATSRCFLEVLKEKQEKFHKHPRQYPALETAVFLKLIPVLFSASDFRHPVVSPSLVFISEILSRCLISCRKDVVIGFFLVTTVLECVEHSKRILPAVINFLNGVIYVCSPKRIVQTVAIVPPFQSTAPWNSLLVMEERIEENIDLQLRSEDFLFDFIDEEFKLRALYCALEMIKDICQNQSGSLASYYIGKNFLVNLTRLNEISFPVKVDNALKKTVASVQELKAYSLERLVAPEQKPKALRLLEPKIERTYDHIARRPSKHKLTVKEHQKKLKKKVKQEARAATREIRQDNDFLAKLQYIQRATSDRKRRDKVKRIFSDATLQQGEIKSFDRKSKYKK